MVHSAPVSIPTMAVLLAFAAGAQQPASVLPDTAGPATRVWCAGGDGVLEVWFRRSITVGKGCTSLRLYVSCDNECTVYVDGKPVATNHAHEHLTLVDLLPPAAGSVTVGVHAVNHGSNAALAAWIVWHDAAGRHEVVSDAQWRLATTATDGWAEPACDDRRWETAVGDHTTQFGRNVYNGVPARLQVVSAFLPAVDPLERALEQLRRASDKVAAAKALDALERAVVEARAELWRKPERPAR